MENTNTLRIKNNNKKQSKKLKIKLRQIQYVKKLRNVIIGEVVNICLYEVELKRSHQKFDNIFKLQFPEICFSNEL